MQSFIFKSAEDLLQFIKDEKNDVEIVACIITNLLGGFYKCFFYAKEINLHKIQNGFPFDASSIELCSDVEVSDFYMKLDYTSCWMERYNGKNILNALCDIKTFNGSDYFKCPRTILRKACDFIKKTGVADQICFGNEIEFFIFDKINYSVDEYNMYLKIYDGESFICKNNTFKSEAWNKACYANISMASNNELPHEIPYQSLTNDDSKKIKRKGGYFRTSPKDTSNLIKHKICRILNDLKIDVQRYHHEVSSSQHEISLKYFDVQKNADNLFISKQIIRHVVNQFNRTITFMPKPFTNDNGSGLHCNISLWKNGKNLFFRDNPATFYFSKECFYFMNGVIKHSKALQAFCNSTMNSYKRLCPGFETSQKLFYSYGSRIAVIRLSLIDYDNPSYKRIEYRLPDMANSPHIMFAAIILAGYDGLRNKEPPLPPLEHQNNKFFISSLFTNYVQNKHEFESITHVLKEYGETKNIKEDEQFKEFFKVKEPEDISFSLSESLDALEKDHDFLTRDGIFSEEMIQEYIAYKREEISSFTKQVVPQDYHYYFDC